MLFKSWFIVYVAVPTFELLWFYASCLLYVHIKMLQYHGNINPRLPNLINVSVCHMCYFAPLTVFTLYLTNMYMFLFDCWISISSTDLPSRAIHPCVRFLSEVINYLYPPFGYERVYLLLGKVPHTPFHIWGDDIYVYVDLLFLVIYLTYFMLIWESLLSNYALYNNIDITMKIKTCY